MAADAQMLLAGDFGETAITTLCAATREYLAVETRGVIAPHHDLAAVTASERIGL